MSTGDDKHQVGGRPGDRPAPGGRGGYRDICNNPGLPGRVPAKNFAEKLKITIKDLEKMGLSGQWLEVARHIGVEQWLEVWAILDRENINQPPSARDSKRIRVPTYSKYIKFVRNRWIHEMAAQGMDMKTIHQQLKKYQFDPVCIAAIRVITKDIRGSNG